MVKFIVFLTCIVLALGKQSEEYFDPIIDMLLNGTQEDSSSNEDLNATSAMSGGIWKCGNCTNLGEAQVTHSEINSFDSNVDSSDLAEVQLYLTMESMRCVTVTADRPGAVKRVLGTCNGSSVTLDLSPSHNFTVLVYT